MASETINSSLLDIAPVHMFNKSHRRAYPQDADKEAVERGWFGNCGVSVDLELRVHIVLA